MKKTVPSFHVELTLWKRGYDVIGVDEVGRGAFAGPLYVGAVCFTPRLAKFIESLGINDSKKLTAKQREYLSVLIRKHACAYSTAYVTNNVVDSLGLVRATEKAMRRAVHLVCQQLKNPKKFVLVDAFYIKYLRSIGLRNQSAIIKGDEKVISISAASIVAKVERDHIMHKLDQQYPIYNWKSNKGYGTIEHRSAIKKYGKSRHHRTSFLRKLHPLEIFS